WATLSWMLHPNEHTSGKLVACLKGPGADVGGVECRAEAEWLTLVARHCRTGSMPHPLNAELLQAGAMCPIIVATRSHAWSFSPALVHGAARRFLDTQVRTIEAAGHLSPHEHPEQVRELLRGFVA